MDAVGNVFSCTLGYGQLASFDQIRVGYYRCKPLLWFSGGVGADSWLPLGSLALVEYVIANASDYIESGIFC